MIMIYLRLKIHSCRKKIIAIQSLVYSCQMSEKSIEQNNFPEVLETVVPNTECRGKC